MTPSPRLAAVDIGTNSVLLLIAARGPDGSLEAVHESCTITRLGQGVDATGRIADEAYERTVAELRRCAATMHDHDVGPRGALGTSALRDADNGAALREEAAAILGCPLQVVDGAREAALVLAGVRSSFGALPPGTVLFDVGGGSTELIRVASGGADPELASLDLGAVRLTERHLHHDPPTRAQVDLCRRDAAALLVRLDPAAFGPPTGELVGIAGTVTTLAAVELGLQRHDSARINGHRLDRAQVQAQIMRYAELPRAEREQIVGLEPARADVILAGAVVVDAVLEHFGATGLRVSDRGVRWGLAAELAGSVG